MTAREWLDQWLGEQDDSLPVWDGCDEAIVGVASRCSQPDAVVYDYQKLVEVFEAQGMSPDDAEEWIGFNLLGAWIGDSTPLILFRPAPEEVPR